MNWKENILANFYLAIYLLTFPAGALLVAYFNFHLLIFFFIYTLLTRYQSFTFWLLVILHGYQKPDLDTRCEEPSEFNYSNPWQLLLFPARIDSSEFNQALDTFKKSGFKVWEGKFTALLCTLGVTGDPLDGFEENWGCPLSFYTIFRSLLIQLLWDGSIAWIYLHSTHDGLGYVLCSVASIELGALCYFYYLEKFRFSKLVKTEVKQSDEQ